MKLLYIHQYFKFPDMSGGTRSYDLAASFRDKGIDVTVITSDTTNNKRLERWQKFEREGIQFYVLNCPYNNSMGFAQRIMSFVKFLWFASLKSLKVKSDMVLATSTPLTIAVPALVKKMIAKTPYIFEVRDVWPDVPIKMGFVKNKLAIKLLYCLEKLIYKRAAWIVPLSVGMDQNISMRYLNNKSTVIPNISELARFENVTSKVQLPFDEKGKKILLYAGTFGEVNGIEYLVDLAQKTIAIDGSLVYLLYGNGAKLSQVLKLAEEKGVLGKNLYYGGVVAKSDLPYLYSVCTVGCSTVVNNSILWDNSANKFFDTLAASRPIVINHKGWQADTIKKHNVGYVLPPFVDYNVSKEFVEYMSNAELLKAQCTNARKLAQEEYSLSVATERYMQIFNRVCNK